MPTIRGLAFPIDAPHGLLSWHTSHHISILAFWVAEEVLALLQGWKGARNCADQTLGSVLVAAGLPEHGAAESFIDDI